MIVTPSSFTYEHLSSLKFKELQKLSVQFHVNKRWAKKQELIENLLALKEKSETVVEDEQEWRDANTIFGDLKFKNENKSNKRLTYNIITKCSVEHKDPHLTFEVPQNGENLLCETVYSRETYDIPPTKTDFGLELLTKPTDTFEISPKKNLTNETDSRAAFDIYEMGDKLLEKDTMSKNRNLHKKNSDKKSVNHFKLNIKVDGSKLKQDIGNPKKFDLNPKNRNEEKEKKKTEFKFLTLPHAKATRRVIEIETSGNEKSPIKMSKKSINIKKPTRLPVRKEDFMRSPFSLQKSAKKQAIIQSLTKNQEGKLIQSKVPIRLEERSKLVNDNNKENIKKNLRKQLTKTTIEGANNEPHSTKVNLKTLAGPCVSSSKNQRVVVLKKTTLRKDTQEGWDASTVQTPSNKPISKPITATKMPDFSKIHKRRFEQMDSLHDYLKKKEDRIRKLFGTPQPGQQLHNLNKSAPVFHFQSTTVTEKKNNQSESLKTLPATPLKKKENDPKFTKKEAFKSKLRFSNKYITFNSRVAKGKDISKN